MRNLTLILTTNCNLICSYCYCGKKTNEKMTLEIAQKSIDYFCVHKNEEYTINYFGGEPLLEYLLIDKVCEYAKMKLKNVSFSMTTNGTLLNKESIDVINKWKINIMISIDGYGEEHNLYRKYYDGIGSWDDIYRNVSTWLTNKPVIRLTYTSKSIYNLYNNIVKLYSEGYKNMAFSHTCEPEWHEKDILEYEQEYTKIAKFYLECYRRGEYVKFYEFERIIFSHLLKQNRKCYPGINQVAILPTGKVVPCHRVNFLEPKVSFGNILETIDNTKLESFKHEIYTIDTDCTDCSIRERCSSCVFENLEITGKVYKIPDYICYFNRTKIRIVDEVAAILYKERNPLFMSTFYKKL